MSNSDSRLSPGRLSAFSSLEISMSAFIMPLVVFIPSFYAGEMGLGLGLVGMLFGLTKVWDIFTDPIAGAITERVGPTFGRWRFWLLISLPLMLLGVYKVFFPSQGVTGFYFAFWMIFIYIGWTLMTISHISWGVELSDDYSERSRVASYRQFASLIGALLVFAIPVLSDQFGAGTETARINAMGLFIFCTLPLFTLAVFWATPVQTVKLVEKETHSWRDSFIIFARNKDLRALLFGNMGMLLGVSAGGSAMLFFVQDVLRLEEWSTFAIIPMLLSGLLFVPVIKYFANKIGKHRTLRWVLAAQMCAQLSLLVLPPNNLPLTVFCFLSLGIVQGAVIFLPQAMIADLKDVNVGSGVGHTGIYVALLQSTSKISAALAVGVMFLVLPLTGYDPEPDVINDAGSLDGLRQLIAWLPITFFAVAWFSMRNYTLEKPKTEVEKG